MRFAWDKNKNQANKRKHGLSFELAARVFLDPGRIERYDDRTPLHEDRWITIGMAGPAVIVVAYTVREEDGEVIRLISARKANAQEREAYRRQRA